MKEFDLINMVQLMINMSMYFTGCFFFALPRVHIPLLSQLSGFWRQQVQ